MCDVSTVRRHDPYGAASTGSASTSPLYHYGSPMMMTMMQQQQHHPSFSSATAAPAAATVIVAPAAVGACPESAPDHPQQDAPQQLLSRAPPLVFSSPPPPHHLRHQRHNAPSTTAHSEEQSEVVKRKTVSAADLIGETAVTTHHPLLHHHQDEFPVEPSVAPTAVASSSSSSASSSSGGDGREGSAIKSAGGDSDHARRCGSTASSSPSTTPSSTTPAASVVLMHSETPTPPSSSHHPLPLLHPTTSPTTVNKTTLQQEQKEQQQQQLASADVSASTTSSFSSASSTTCVGRHAVDGETNHHHTSASSSFPSPPHAAVPCENACCCSHVDDTTQPSSTSQQVGVGTAPTTNLTPAHGAPQCYDEPPFATHQYGHYLQQQQQCYQPYPPSTYHHHYGEESEAFQQAAVDDDGTAYTYEHYATTTTTLPPPQYRHHYHVPPTDAEETAGYYGMPHPSAPYHHHHQVGYGYDCSGGMAYTSSDAAVSEHHSSSADGAAALPPPPQYRTAIEALFVAGEELPDEAARFLARLAKRRKQRKERAARKKSSFRAAAAAARAAELQNTNGTSTACSSTTPRHGDDGGDESNDTSYGDGSDYDDDDEEGFDAPAAHKGGITATAALPKSDDDDDENDPDARQVPVCAPERKAAVAGTGTSPTVPLPRSAQHLLLAQQQHQQQPTTGAAFPPTSSTSSSAAASRAASSVPPPTPKSVTVAAAAAPIVRAPTPAAVAHPQSSAAPPPVAAAPHPTPKPTATTASSNHHSGSSSKANSGDQWKVVVSNSGGTGAASKAPPKTAAGAASEAKRLVVAANPFAALMSGGGAPRAAASSSSAKGATTTAKSQPQQQQQQQDSTKRATTKQQAPAEQSAPLQKPVVAAAATAPATATAAKQPAKTNKATTKTAANGDDEFEAMLRELQQATASRAEKHKKSAANATASAPPPPPSDSDASALVLSTLKSTVPVVGPDGGVTTIARIEAAVSHVSGVVQDVLRLLRRAEVHRRNPLQRYQLLRPLEGLLDTPKNLPRAVHALLLIDFADLWLDFQEFDRGLELAEMAFALHVDDVSDMRAKYREAKALEQLGDVDEAMTALDACLVTAAKLGDDRYLAYSAVLYGVCAEYVGSAHIAKACLISGETIARALNDTVLLTDCLINRAAALIARGEYVTAGGFLDRAEPLVEASVDPQVAVKFLSHRSQYDFAVGNVDAAVAKLSRSYGRFQHDKEYFAVASCCTLLGMFYRCLGQPERALEWYTRDLHVATTQLPQRICETQGNMGSVLLELGDLKQAKQHHQKELEVAKKTHDLIGECKAQLGLAQIELRSGDLDCSRKRAATILHIVRAFLVSAEAERYIQRVNAYEVEWRALDVIETSHQLQGNYAAAMMTSDEKRCAAVNRRIVAAAASSSSTAASTAAEGATDNSFAAWLSTVREKAGFDVVVSYSFLWDDVCDSIGVYTCDCRTAQVYFARVPYPAHALALLVAEKSAFRQRVYRGETDVVMLPFQVTRLAEAFAAAHLDVLNEPEHEGEITHSDGKTTVDVCAAWQTVFYDAFVAPALASLPASASGCVGAASTMTELGIRKLAFAVDGLLSNVPFYALRPRPDAPMLIETDADGVVVAQVPSLRVLACTAGVTTVAPSDEDVAVRVVAHAAPATDEAAVKRALQHDATDDEFASTAAEGVVFPWRIADDARDRVAGTVLLDLAIAPSSSTTAATVDAALAARVWRGPPTIRLEAVCPSTAARPFAHRRTAVLQRSALAGPRAGHELGVSPRTFFFCVGFTGVVTSLFGNSNNGSDDQEHPDDDLDAGEAEQWARVRTASEFRDAFLRLRRDRRQQQQRATWRLQDLVIFTGGD